MKYIAKNEKETVDIGKKISAELKGGDILCLYGDLGAGKTTLVKGLAKGFGIKKEVVSPTFSIFNLFEIENKSKVKSKKSKVNVKNQNLPKYLAHFDLYRLKDADEFLDMGGADYLGAPDTICVIEWPEKIEEILKTKKTIDVAIEHLKNGRSIITSP